MARRTMKRIFPILVIAALTSDASATCPPLPAQCEFSPPATPIAEDSSLNIFPRLKPGDFRRAQTRFQLTLHRRTNVLPPRP
jgi:hypothetical protein